MATGTILIEFEGRSLEGIEIKGDVPSRLIPGLQRRIFNAFRQYKRAITKANAEARAENAAKEEVTKEEVTKEKVVVDQIQTVATPQFVPPTRVKPPSILDPNTKVNQFSHGQTQANKPKIESEDSNERTDITTTANGSSEGSEDGEGSSSAS